MLVTRSECACISKIGIDKVKQENQAAIGTHLTLEFVGVPFTVNIVQLIEARAWIHTRSGFWRHS